MKLLLYCNKTKPYLVYGCTNKYILSYGYDTTYSEEVKNNLDCFNGKIVGECDFNVEEFINPYFPETTFVTCSLTYEKFLKQSCLTENELNKYISKGKRGYVIHIKNLHIFDSSKELNELYSIHNIGGMLLTDKLKKAPQNMQRISLHEWEYGTFNPNDVAILISISSQEFCEILNGEKTIVIKKKVLKEML